MKGCPECGYERVTWEEDLHRYAALANAIAAMKPEWEIGEESKKVWKEFVAGFQSRKLSIVDNE